jgi:hypothetical protein
MKQLLVFFAAIMLCDNSSGQIAKGNWLNGGNAGFFSSRSTYTSTAYNQESKEFNLTVYPNIGYFPVDKFAVGLRPYFSWGKGKVTTTGGGTSDVKRYGIGPFARYYFLKADKPFNLLADISYQFGTYNATGEKGKLSNFSIAAGSVIYFNTSVGLEFLMGYSSRIDDIKSSYKTTSKGFQAGIGFQIHLEKL